MNTPRPNVRVTTAPPVDPKHRVLVGCVFRVLRRGTFRGSVVVIGGSEAEEVTLLSREFEYTADPEMNENGLTLERWCFAAGWPEPGKAPYSARLAWRAGEDPAEHLLRRRFREADEEAGR